MGWLRSLFSPLKKVWDRLSSPHRKSKLKNSCYNYHLLECITATYSLTYPFSYSFIVFLQNPYPKNTAVLFMVFLSWFFFLSSFHGFAWNPSPKVVIYFHLSHCFGVLCFFSNVKCVFDAGRGIYILYEDVKSCQYEDVHVLWSILVESHAPTLPSKAWGVLLSMNQTKRVFPCTYRYLIIYRHVGLFLHVPMYRAWHLFMIHSAL